MRGGRWLFWASKVGFVFLHGWDGGNGGFVFLEESCLTGEIED